MEGIRKYAFALLVVVAVMGALIFALRGGPARTSAPPSVASVVSVASAPSAAPSASASAVASALPAPPPSGALPIDPERVLANPPTEKPKCPGLQFVDQWEGKSHTRGCIVMLPDGGVAREGSWVFQDDEGWTSAGEFKNDMKEGRWTRWYANGHVAWVEDWSADQRNGAQIQWDENGARVLERHWKNGLLEGEDALTMPDGTIVRKMWKHGVEQK